MCLLEDDNIWMYVSAPFADTIHEHEEKKKKKKK